MEDRSQSPDDTLESLLRNVAAWPDDDRAELLDAAREIEARRTGVYVPTPEERAAIEEGLADAARGAFIEGEELEAFWKSLRV